MMRRILSPRSSRPHRKCRSASYGQAEKKHGFSLPLAAMDLDRNPIADRLTKWKNQGHFSGWAAEVAAVTALPLGRALGEPTVLCSRMDESTIVGYYTFAKVHLRSPSPRKPTQKGA